ncbi:MAG: hypothetical protein KDA68_04175 [Planctomycetaceae bacterium]|nr:hypothetical protein [Planctomycetaceae bacterium]
MLKNSRLSRGPSRRHRRQTTRRGSISVLAVCVLIMVFGMLAFAADVGFISASRSQMRNASDAAALAACQELSVALGVAPSASADSAKTAADGVAVTLASLHRAGDVTSLAVSPSSDVRYGNREWNAAQQCWVETWGVGPYNMVEVTVRRDQIGGGGGDRALNLFFAPVLNQNTATVQVSSAAALLPTVGFGLPSGSSKTIGILPIALDDLSWDNLVLNNSGSDNYAYNPNTGTVSNGSDGIKEVNLYPSGSTSMPPGNRGTVDLGSSNNSTNDLKRQILHGLNADDLSYFPNGQIRTDNGPLYLNGDTGISAGIKSELSQIIGQTRAIPIFSEVSGPGNNATYTIVKFVGIRVLDVVLTGSLSSKRVVVQPAEFQDPNTIGGKVESGPDTIFSPIKLIH